MREEAVLFGQARSLVGILTNPEGGAGDTTLPGVVLLNSGVVHRVGPQRLYVKLARHLAGMGFVVLRFDFSGVGESNVRQDNLPFERSAVSEAQEAMDYLGTRRGVGRFVLAGLCSGANASLQTACCDPRVVGAVLLNSEGFELDTEDEMSSSFLLRSKARHFWKSALFNPKMWLRAVTGKADYGDFIRVFGYALRSKFAAKKTGPCRPSKYAESLRSAPGRGVRLLLVFSEGDPGLDYLHEILGGELQQVCSTGNVGVHVIPHSDHTFTLLRNQERLLKIVCEWARECFVTAGWLALQKASG